MGTETIPNNQEADKADSLESPSELEEKIIRQIEYYFGNYNLSKDKFLREQIKLDNGWVPLETMVKFNRLKILSEDFAVITGALKKSQNQLMEVNEDNTKIRRRVEKPVPEDFSRSEEIDEKTLYVKGFKKTTTLDELLDYFKDHKAEHISMRRRNQGNNRVFKGSVFVTFETKEDAEKFLEAKGTKFCGTELLKEKKKDYFKRKDTFFENLRAEKAKKKAKKAEENETKPDTEVAEPDVVPGCLLKINGLGETSTREDINEALKSYGTIAFYGYFKGNPSGVIRFETPVVAKILENAEEEDGEKKIQIGSCKATISAIEGEDEKEHWKNYAVQRANSRARYAKNQKHSGNKGRFKKNWGKRQRGRNWEDENSEEPNEKKSKTDSSAEVTESNSEEPEQKTKGGDSDKVVESNSKESEQKTKGGDSNKVAESNSKEPAQKKRKAEDSDKVAETNSE
ncbi:Lupus La protein, partial [Stegodyphus mimosarum]